MNPLLYGHNPKQGVVAVHQLNDRFIRLYSRIDGKIQHEDAEFFPFFFLSNPALLEGFSKQFWLKQLSGTLHYRHIAAFSRWSEMWEAIHYALNAFNKYAPKKASHYNEVDEIILRPDPVYQFLAQSGITLFKGMEFDDLHRIQIDIQRSSASSPAKSKTADGIVQRMVLSDNLGWYESLESEDTDAKGMVTSFISAVRERDPDILEGHGLNSQVLPTLVALAERNSIDLALGRDGSVVKHFSPRQFFWTSDGDSGYYEVAGRHLIDTQRLAEIYDSTSRSFENLNLDYLAQYFGLDSPPTAVPNNPAHSEDARRTTRKTKQPPLENVQRVRRLSEFLSLSNFYVAQMCPFNFGTLFRLGSAAKIESLLFREYLRQKHSLPKQERGSQSRGGYTDIFYSGVFSSILHADVEALYPSIITSQKIRPKSDVLGVFTPILAMLTEMRLAAKHNSQQAATPHARFRYDALQSALKILINSFYGYLAYARAYFNDYEQADRITGLGQTYLRMIIEEARRVGAQVLEVDTDGLLFIPPAAVVGTDAEDQFVKRLATVLPEGINLMTAGRYAKMVSYRKKNYALLDYSGRIIIKGSSLISRSLELFARRYIEKCVECLLKGDVETLHRTYVALHRRILAHQWSAREFCRTETIKDDLDTYDREVGQGNRAPSAPIEAAKRASLYPVPGMVVRYYVTGNDPNVKIVDNCRIAAEWDSNLPDDNTPYYLSRLNESSAKFRDFFTPGDFEKIFSTDDLFGFSPAGIAILNRDLQAETPDTSAAEPDDEFPIWLGDQPV